MKHVSPRRCTFVAICAVSVWLGTTLTSAAAIPAGKPNVLFIVADDLGFGDLRCYGNPYVDTPVLDQLAKSGVRFTDYYTPSPLCAPARAGLLTGRYNHRTGAIDVSSNRGIDRIALSEKTFGDYFRHAGYATAMIGKWHSGLYCDEYLPHHRGFDLFHGFANGAHDYWKWQLARNGATDKSDGRYLTDALNDETIAFMEKNRDRPFAIFLAHHAPHVPFQAPEELVTKYKARSQGRYNDTVATIYAMIEAMDRGLGRVFTALDKLGIRERTIVVFTSDNGAQFGLSGEGTNEGTDRFHGPYRGNKDTVLEQGVRVPAIVAWPGTIPSGRVAGTPVHGCDWLPTLFARTGATMPDGAKPFDGRDIFAVLRGDPAPELEQRSLQFQKNRYLPVALSDAAIRRGPWKLFWPGIAETIKKDGPRDNWSYWRGIVQPHWEMPIDPDLPEYANVRPEKPKLYNLVEDPGEKNDLAANHPELVAELSRSHEAWFREVFAEWRVANQRIREHDRAYWSTRPIPDPRSVMGDFWLRNNRNAKTAKQDPLEVVTGYWSYDWYRERATGAKALQKP